MSQQILIVQHRKGPEFNPQEHIIYIIKTHNFNLRVKTYEKDDSDIVAIILGLCIYSMGRAGAEYAQGA